MQWIQRRGINNGTNKYRDVKQEQGFDQMAIPMPGRLS
jgi:cellulase/cellobiase CelA1